MNTPEDIVNDMLDLLEAQAAHAKSERARHGSR
jgi:hypothetical protein